MKIVTKENMETIKEFQNHYLIATSKPIIICMGIVLLSGIINTLLGNIITGIYLITFSIFLVIFYPLILKYSNKIFNKSNKNSVYEKINEIEFMESRFSLKSYFNEEVVSSLICKYSDLYKVDETETSFYLYVTMNMAISIAKSDMDSNEENQLRGILQGMCLKYKKSKY